MSCVPGSPKTGGRKKGSPNKRTQELLETLNQLKIDLPTKILEIIPNLSPAKQADVYLQLMPYFYPKRKPADPTQSKSTQSNVVIYIPDNGRDEATTARAVPYKEVRRAREKPHSALK